jgi:hypothetical protein
MLTAPALSPDGRTVAFVQQSFDPAPPGTIQIRWIWTVRTDGSKLRRLALGDWPHWTPNGRRIVFQRFDAFGSIRSIASMRRDGTDRRRVLWTAQDETLLDVSPDGQRVLWRGNGNSPKGPQRWGLYTSDLGGHHIHLVHRSPPTRPTAAGRPTGRASSSHGRAPAERHGSFPPRAATSGACSISPVQGSPGNHSLPRPTGEYANSMRRTAPAFRNVPRGPGPFGSRHSRGRRPAWRQPRRPLLVRLSSVRPSGTRL